MSLDGGEARGEFFDHAFEARDARVPFGVVPAVVALACRVFAPLVQSFGHKIFFRPGDAAPVQIV